MALALFTLHPALLIRHKDNRKMWLRGLEHGGSGSTHTGTCAPPDATALVAVPEAICAALAAACGTGAGTAAEAQPVPGEDVPALAWRHEHSGRMSQLKHLVASLAAAGETEVAVFCHFPAAADTLAAYMPEALPGIARWVRVAPMKSTGATQSSKRQTQKFRSRQADTKGYRQWQQQQRGNTTTTPDGRHLCFNYNRRGPDGCAKAQCTSAHVCDRPACAQELAGHPRHACPVQPAGMQDTTSACVDDVVGTHHVDPPHRPMGL